MIRVSEPQEFKNGLSGLGSGSGSREEAVKLQLRLQVSRQAIPTNLLVIGQLSQVFSTWAPSWGQLECPYNMGARLVQEP
jgi:hypothetical protein